MQLDISKVIMMSLQLGGGWMETVGEAPDRPAAVLLEKKKNNAEPV